MIVLAFISIGIVIAYINITKKMSHKVSAHQIDNNQKILVQWDKISKHCKLTIKAKYNKKYYFHATLTDKQAHLGFYELPTFYGRQKIIIQIQKGIFKSSTFINVNVTTEKYIIAPLTATLPTSLFTLSLKEITNNYSTPTFV